MNFGLFLNIVNSCLLNNYLVNYSYKIIKEVRTVQFLPLFIFLIFLLHKAVQFFSILYHSPKSGKRQRSWLEE